MTSALESTLEILLAAYTADHASRVRATVTPRNTCGYCGRSWIPFGGSRLAGHATCVVSDQFQRLVECRLRCDPRLSIGAIAKALGVSVATVTAWVRHARQIRGAA